MELDPTAVTSGATLGLVIISLWGAMIRMNRLFAGLTAKVSALDVKVEALDAKVDALAADTRVIRHRRKLDAVVHNAQRMVELEAQHGGFQAYLRSHGDFEATVADLRKRFRFLGDTGCYYFLYVVGEEVPSYEDWCASRGRPHH